MRILRFCYHRFHANLDSGPYQISMELFERLKYGDLKERYRNDVFHGFDEYRGVMMSIMNVICGKIEIECASAVDSLVNSPKLPGNYLSTDMGHVTWLIHSSSRRRLSRIDCILYKSYKNNSESGQYCFRMTSSEDASLCQHPEYPDCTGPSQWAGDDFKVTFDGPFDWPPEESIPSGFNEVEHCFDFVIDDYDYYYDDSDEIDIDFYFQMKELAYDGVCITSLSFEGDQLLVGQNNNLSSFWLDRDQNYCLDGFMSTPHIEFRISYQNSNAQVISSRCKDRK